MSEAEWEYCCRAGTERTYSFGDTITKDQAQFGMGQTVEVGKFPANAFGLHDMHGNVWEWVQDAYEGTYKGTPTDGSAREATGNIVSRVLRGGSWLDYPLYLRSADRFRYQPVIRDSLIGFRLARTLIP